jgi:hypothetical protein
MNKKEYLKKIKQSGIKFTYYDFEDESTFPKKDCQYLILYDYDGFCFYMIAFYKSEYNGFFFDEDCKKEADIKENGYKTFAYKELKDLIRD